MGLEARCVARYGEQTCEGKAHLESDRVKFRGQFRFEIPFNDISSVEDTEQALTIRTRSEVAVLELGPASAKWAARIRNPRGRLDKLGVKRGMRVSVQGAFTEDFVNELRDRGVTINAKPAASTEIVFLGVETSAQLSKLERLEKAIPRNAAIWVIYPKGQPHITQAQVLSAIRQAGLVDTKVASFSQTHTALKAVVPATAR
jgi:hypothetical protein